MKQKNKKCKVCKDDFYPENEKQIVCGWQCALKHASVKSQKEKKIKQIQDKKETKAKRLELTTPTEWKNKLQKYFNKFIRIRDVKKGCISCGTSLENSKYDAGHFWEKSRYPFLRFDENNCFGQCVRCNKHRGSNAHEYRLRITERITPDQLMYLDDHRWHKLELTVDQIEQKIEFYKQKIKQLQVK